MKIPHPVAVEPNRPRAARDSVRGELVYGAFAVTFALLLPVGTGCAGCSSQQLAADEAAVNAALVKLEAAVDWTLANKADVKAAVAQAVALDPTNKTLQAVQSKTDTALDSGALNLAHLAVVGGIALTQPAAAPSPAAK